MRLARLCVFAALPGCAELAGVDDYSVDPNPPDPNVPGCADELASGPACDVTVGVDDCGDHFDPDGRGGCNPVFFAGCEAGQVSRLGQRGCVQFGSACFDSSPFDIRVTADLWVLAGAPVDGDGSPERPFPSIQAALDAAPAGATIAIGSGSYPEALAITRPVTLLGHCAARTVLEPGAPAVAAIHVETEGAVSISALRVRGASTGLRVAGKSRVSIAQTRFHELSGAGIEIDSQDADTQVDLDSVLIEGAVGAGVSVRGARLNATSLFVRGTVPDASGHGGFAVAAYTARYANQAQVSAPVRSTVTLKASVLEQNSGAALVVEGSAATVERVVIHGVTANGVGQSHGVIVRRRPLGAVPASLQVSQSVLTGHEGVGVLVEDLPVPSSSERRQSDPGVELELSRTTIRAPAASAQPACVGSAVRVRSAGMLEREEAPVRLSSTLIEGAREAGVHVEGAHAVLEQTLIRGTTAGACGDDGFGDGVAVYGDQNQPARVEIRDSRVADSARAAVANFGAAVSVVDSQLEGCARLVGETPRGGPPTTSLRGSACTCANRSVTCNTGNAALAPSLIGQQGCTNSRDCFISCVDDYFSRSVAPGSDPTQLLSKQRGVAFWSLDQLRTATAATDETGCVSRSGLDWNGPLRHFAMAGETVAPWTGGPLVPRAGASHLTGFILSSVWGVLDEGQNFGRTGGARGLDLARSPWTVVLACQEPEDADPAIPRELCLGRGVAGAQVHDADGADGVQGEPIYNNEFTLPEPDLAGFTQNAVASFVNTVPGEFKVRLDKPEGALWCRADPRYRSATPTDDNVFEGFAWAGFNSVITAFCSVE